MTNQPKMKNENLIEIFNAFIKKWCGESYPHLIDSDENDGERFRELIRQKDSERAMTPKDRKIVEELVEGFEKIKAIGGCMCGFGEWCESCSTDSYYSKARAIANQSIEKAKKHFGIGG